MMPDTLPNPNELLMSSGAKYFNFLTVGTTISGTVVGEPETKLQTDMKTGDVERWPDGKAKFIVVITVQTDQRESEDDDGTRSIWAKGGNMMAAIRDAVAASGAAGVHTGGRLTMTYTGDGTATEKGFNPPKLYKAHYVPPANAGVNDALGLPPETAPPPTPTPPPAAPTVPPPPPGIPQAAWELLTPEQRAKFTPPPQQPSGPAMPPGMDPTVWATLTDDQKKLLASSEPPF